MSYTFVYICGMLDYMYILRILVSSFGVLDKCWNFIGIGVGIRCVSMENQRKKDERMGNEEKQFCLWTPEPHSRAFSLLLMSAAFTIFIGFLDLL